MVRYRTNDAVIRYEHVPYKGYAVPATKGNAFVKDDFDGKTALRERIVGAAFRAFTGEGYSETSMLEIATSAKVSKRDLYAEFRNKDAVLLACIAERAARMRLPADLPSPDSRENLESILMQFGRTVIREVSDQAVIAVYRLAIGEAQRSPEVATILDASRSVNRRALARLLGKAQANGILGPGKPEDMMEEFLALLWGDLMFRRLIGTAGVPKPAEIERRARRATQALLRLYVPDAI
jgi:AcrR family transcriptional regulator